MFDIVSKDKVNAWDFNDLWDGLSGSEDFLMCYTEDICFDVPGYLGPEAALVLGVAEILFWILGFMMGSRILKSHKRMKAKRGNRK